MRALPAVTRTRRFRIVAALLILVTLILWLLPVGLRLGAERYLTETGFTARIGDVDLNLFTGVLEVSEARAERPSGDGFVVGHARVDLEYLPLFSRHLFLQQLQLRGARVDIRRSAEDQLVVAGFPLPGPETPAPAEPSQVEGEATRASWGFGLGGLDIADLALRYREPGFEREIVLSRSRATDVASWRPERSIPLDASLALGESSLQVTGTVAPFGERIHADIELGIRDLALDLVAPVARSAGIEGLAGRLGTDLRIELAYGPDSGLELGVEGTASLDRARLEMPPTLELDNADLQWQGRVAVELPGDRTADRVEVDGRLDLRNADLLLPKRLAWRQRQLEWNGLVEAYLGSDRPTVTVEGRLGGTDSVLELMQSSPALRIAGGQLEWAGRLALDPAAEGVPEGADVPLRVTGAASLDGLGLSVAGREGDVLSIAGTRVRGIDIAGLGGIRIAEVGASGIAALARPAGAPRRDEHPHVARLETLSVQQVTLLDQARLGIGQVELSGLRALLFRGSEGPWGPLAAADALAAPQTDTTPEAATPATAETPAGLELEIGAVTLEDAGIEIEDRGVAPVFATTVSGLRFGLSELASARPDQRSPVQLSASIGRYGEVDLDGWIKPFQAPPSAALEGRLEAIDLVPASAYVQQALGRRVEQGTLSADLTADLDRGAIEANAAVTLNQFRIGPGQGKTGEIESQLGLPLDKALTLLRDGDGNVVLDLPVGGSLDDPSFSLAGIMRTAVINGLKVAILNYYSPLGLLNLGKKLVDLATALRFDPVGFEPGSAALDEDDRDYLDKMAELLEARPRVQFVVCGHAVPADRAALALPPASEQLDQDGARAVADRLLQLAAGRGEVVSDYLVDQGIAASRLVPCNPKLGEAEDAKPRASISL